MLQQTWMLGCVAAWMRSVGGLFHTACHDMKQIYLLRTLTKCICILCILCIHAVSPSGRVLVCDRPATMAKLLFMPSLFAIGDACLCTYFLLRHSLPD